MMLQRPLSCVATWLVSLGLASAATAEAVPEQSSEASSVPGLRQALEQGVLRVDLRYRLEGVDDEAFDTDAVASTLRGVLSYKTQSFRGFSAGVSFETVSPIGNNALYNNLGHEDLWNGVTNRPAVADPKITEVDHIYLAYRGPAGLEARAGRFAYTLDNQRFVGIAGWRQNHRSYEGLSLAFGSREVLRASYAYLRRVHYNNGANPDIDAHLLHLSRELGPGSLSGYAYLLDWENDDRAALSSATYGLRYAGSSSWRPWEVLYFAEYARQLDHGDNPASFSLDYAHLGLGLQKGGWSVQAAWELKDGDGMSAVQTPLGTNHGKNGFADRLVATPPEGSHDVYVRLAMERKRWSWLLDYHDFLAARGSARLGQEVDFQASYQPTDPLTLHLKVAHYMADTWLTDISKVMVWASWSFETSF